MTEQNVYLVKRNDVEQAHIIIAKTPPQAREIASKKARGKQEKQAWLDAEKTSVVPVGRTRRKVAKIVLTGAT